MRGALQDLDVVMENEDVSVREACWGTMHVERGSFHKEMDVTPLLKGLPNDRCQSPHWGYLFKGTIRVRYHDREEVIHAGDSYYIEPNHAAVMEAGTEYLEFSPEEHYHRTMDTINRNLQAMDDQG